MASAATFATASYIVGSVSPSSPSSSSSPTPSSSPMSEDLSDSGSSPLSFSLSELSLSELSLSELSLPEVEARLHASVEAEDLFPSRLIPQPAAVETETTDGNDRRCFVLVANEQE